VRSRFANTAPSADLATGVWLVLPRRQTRRSPHRWFRHAFMLFCCCRSRLAVLRRHLPPRRRGGSGGCSHYLLALSSAPSYLIAGYRLLAHLCRMRRVRVPIYGSSALLDAVHTTSTQTAFAGVSRLTVSVQHANGSPPVRTWFGWRGSAGGHAQLPRCITPVVPLADACRDAARTSRRAAYSPPALFPLCPILSLFYAG